MNESNYNVTPQLPKLRAARRGIVSAFVLLCLLFVVSRAQLSAAIESNTGNIHFNSDGQNNNDNEMTLSSDGLGIGIATAAANLHVSGNAIVSDKLSIGSSSSATSALFISGTLGHNIQIITGNTTLSGNSYIIGQTSTGNITLNLPSASNATGRMYTIKKTIADNELILIGEIESSESYTFSSGNMGSLKVFSNGMQWWVIGQSFTGVEGGGIVGSDNLVGWWKLDETSGTTAVDSSSQGNDGVFVGAPSIGNSGAIGVSYTLSANNDYLDISNASFMASHSQGSISAWVKTSTDINISNRAQTVFGLSDGVNQFFYLCVGDGGTSTLTNEIISLIIGDGNSNRVGYLTATRTELIDGNWHHIVLTGDGSTYKIYLDGVSKTVTPRSGFSNNGLWFNTQASVTKAYIGAAAQNASKNNYMNGGIDDVRVYNKVLSATEIQTIYSAGQ